MEIKIRFVRNWVTTLIGALLMAAALFLYVASKMPEPHFEYSFIQLLPAIALGWVLLWAKDSILEGISLGLFKIKAK